MPNYVLGFLFDPKYEAVVLVKKERPTWQKGLWNGVGGMVEDGEDSIRAMRREFEEETGVFVMGWQHYITAYFPEGRLEVFWTASPDISVVETKTDEEIAAWLVTEVLGGGTPLVKDTAEFVNTALRCREAVG